MDNVPKKVIVLGCSFSDYTGSPDATYGALLADYFKAEYIDLAAGCGSNERSSRLLLTGIRKNKINSDDLVIIQYTNPLRKEFVTNQSDFAWPDIKREIRDYYKPLDRSNFNEDLPTIPLQEAYNQEFDMIKFKFDSYTFQSNKVLKEFMENFTRFFLSIEFEEELAHNLHLSLTSTLHSYKIPTVFLRTDYINPTISQENFEKMLFPGQISINLLDFLGDDKSNPEYWLDGAHINTEGHKKVFETIKSHI